VRHARRAGAEVYRHTPVTALTQRADDTWTVTTPDGTIDCDIVVNACGYRVNEVGAMMGVHHPVASMEHQYFITEEILAIPKAASTTCCHGTSIRQADQTVVPSDRLRRIAGATAFCGTGSCRPLPRRATGTRSLPPTSTVKRVSV
jgi:glycine/D-amino acid oxidase-like deaminating enzyme